MEFNNHFLDSLKAEDLKALEPLLERVELERDQLLAEASALAESIYLPIRSVISVIAVMKDGRSVETRTIGCESGYGLLHALGSPYSFERAICQVAGEAWRVPLKGFTQAAIGSPSLVKAIARHAQATLLQAAQSTACNTLHSAEQRLCRWLLLCRERLGSDTLPLTQEHLSIMLGVQRTTITAIASELQTRGLVSYSRGRIQLLDIPALMGSACECYEAIERAIERMLESENA